MFEDVAGSDAVEFEGLLVGEDEVGGVDAPAYGVEGGLLVNFSE